MKLFIEYFKNEIYICSFFIDIYFLVILLSFGSFQPIKILYKQKLKLEKNKLFLLNYISYLKIE